MTSLIEQRIRDIPDFPKPGIVFKDITPVLHDPASLAQTIDLLEERYRERTIDLIAGIESRGFLFAVPLAIRLGIGMIPIRKPGKLPYKTRKATYELEYGTDSIEMHEDALQPGQRILIVDDLLATGGTARAAGSLIEDLGGVIEEFAFLIELSFLEGREKLGKDRVFSILEY